MYEHRGDATAACEALIGAATERWRQAEGNYRDDITAIVVFLPSIFPRLLKARSPPVVVASVVVVALVLLW